MYKGFSNYDVEFRKSLEEATRRIEELRLNSEEGKYKKIRKDIRK